MHNGDINALLLLPHRASSGVCVRRWQAQRTRLCQLHAFVCQTNPISAESVWRPRTADDIVNILYAL